MMFIFICIISFILLWFLWVYDKNDWIKLKGTIKNLLIEKDFEFLVSKTSSDEWRHVLRMRIYKATLGTLLLFVFNLISLSLSPLVFIGIYWIQYKLLKMRYAKELEKALKEWPYLLNEIASLIMNFPVPVALYKALPDCPDLFIDDLKALVEKIHTGGSSLNPYLEFAKLYKQIPDINSIMRSLYTLTITTGNRDSLIISFCNLSTEKQLLQKSMKIDGDIDKQNLYGLAIYISMGFLIFFIFTTINFLGL